MSAGTSQGSPLNTGATVPEELRPQTLTSGSGPLPLPEAFEAGARVGPYLLRKPLGAGGMGVVWLADQLEPVQRPVALKLVQQQMTSGLAEAYFQVERQALAQMNHPAIARIFDAGALPGGAMFFAMEHIEGRTLDQAFAARPGAIGLVVQTLRRVCQGVQHAHQKGVIHRDLKPANILVTEIDGDLQPKIIDFGVAIGMTPGRGAAPVDVAGTEAYMAPEQARPDGRLIDARVDVYALGAVLAELLCVVMGQKPLSAQRGLSSHGLRSAFSASLSPRGAAAPIVPVRELRQIPAALRAIAVRAMAEDREQRYDSAAALAEDLARWQRHEPVQAMPDRGAYRARCFVRRHRLGLAVAGLVMLALGAGLAAALYGLGEAERGRALAQTEARRAQQTSAFLGTVLSSVDPDRARDLDKTLLREVLDQAAKRASQELAGEPGVLGEISLTIGETYYALGDYQPALEHYDRVLAALPQPIDAELLARLRNARAGSLIELSRLPEARAELDAALAEARVQLGTKHPATQRLASKQVWVLYLDGELQAAAAAVEPLLVEVEAVEGPDGNNTLYTLDTAAVIAGYLGDHARAQAHFRQLIERRTRVHGANAAMTLQARQGLGISYIQSQRYADAVTELEALLPVMKARNGPDHPATLAVISSLAGALRQGGRLADSEPYYRTALEGTLRRFGPDHVRSVITGINMAHYEGAAGEGRSALQRLQALEAAVDRLFGPRHLVTADFHRARARAHESLQQWPAAVAAWEQALAISEPLLGAEHAKVLGDREGVARALAQAR